MRSSSDQRNRARALTDLIATLMVEAAAGTGKTSLLAGRVVMLLGSSIPPAEIAAITFTEFAAGELRQRISRYLDDILDGTVPEELALAFPDGVRADQRENLRGARLRLDELTCTTIHGFCHLLLRMYAVEAGIDPGAEILDRIHSDLAFGTLFERWFRGRLDQLADDIDPIGVIARNSPLEAEKLLKEFAAFRRRYRLARPPAAAMAAGDELEFLECVAEFGRWFRGVGGPAQAEGDIADLESLSEHFRGAFDRNRSFDDLWNLAHPARASVMRAKSADLQQYQRLGIWRRAFGQAEGSRLNAEATERWEACARSFRVLMGKLSMSIACIFSTELDELLTAYETFKRNAAVLDFDDLLYVTRKVLKEPNGVRIAAAGKFTRILIDEFQDTDPIQAEIAFLLAAHEPDDGPWHSQWLLPGRLFMVGDPKQGIYRFRGADLATYSQARDAVELQFPGNVIHVTANFRSRSGVIDYINGCFREPLESQQTGYVELFSTRGPASHGLPSVAKVQVTSSPGSYLDTIRDEEARVVADICARLIGNARIPDGEESCRLLLPSDIALLAPATTELWRYERALEEAGLPFSSQAGKNLFRRQEAQDMVALVRALDDARDTLALGALLRGPVVGLTEQELLDVVSNLPPEEGRDLPRLSLRTDPELISNRVAREAIGILRGLRRRVRGTAPYLLLAEAVEKLNIRAVLSSRSADQASRSLANVDSILERARAYSVRGFASFARDLNADWSVCAPYNEGVVDAEGQSISIVTMHTSKGLEWPVVIPINTASRERPPESFVHRRVDETLHWIMDDIVPPGLADAIEIESRERMQESLRLLYVGCTRAMELLIVPEFVSEDGSIRPRNLDFKLQEIPVLNISEFTARPFISPPDARNDQNVASFEDEQEVLRLIKPIRWIRPSDGDTDIVQFRTTPAVAWDQPVEQITVMSPGSSRGMVLHALMEELLTGGLPEDFPPVMQRAAELSSQLAYAGDPSELAGAALRTAALPVLATGRESIVTEVPIYGSVGQDAALRYITGRADAVRYVDGRAETVFDWKSDVAPLAADREAYARQLAQYAHVLGAAHGAVVYMTTGEIQWVEPAKTRA